jgi:hypothetical protein
MLDLAEVILRGYFFAASQINISKSDLTFADEIVQNEKAGTEYDADDEYYRPKGGCFITFVVIVHVSSDRKRQKFRYIPFWPAFEEDS